MEAVVRRLTRADLPQYAALSAFAFQVDEQAQRGALRLLPPVALGAFTPDGDRLLAALRIWPFLAYFQGRPVPTGGVASVASWPEVRRQGLVGRLIRESLELMRAEGQAVSALYPFSYPFYRRYGWDLAFTQTLYQIPMGELDAFRRPPGGHFRPAEPDDLPALDALYRRFVRRWNGPLLRESSWWQQRVLNHPGRPAPGIGARRTVLWEDDHRLQAYVVYGFQSPDPQVPAAEQRLLRVYDWAVEDGGAFRALLSFLVQHDSMAATLILPAPSDWDFLPLLVNLRVEVQKKAGAMLRIIDMDRFLQQVVPPRPPVAPFGDDGSPLPEAVELEVEDELAPWNRGRWLLPLGPGPAQALPPDEPGPSGRGRPRLAGSIQVWSQVLSGYLPALQAWHLGLLTLVDPEAADPANPEPGTDPSDDPMGVDGPLRRRERLLRAFDRRLGLRATYLPDFF